jgi:teichuronic acid exporter
VYSVGYHLVVIPQVRLNPVLNRVAFPVFACRQHDDEAITRGFLEVTRLISYVTFPLLAGLAVVAPQFVPVVFGEQWHQSVPVLQVLCALGILFALDNPQGPVFLAKDRPDIKFKLNLLRLIALGTGIFIAVQGGLIEVAWTYVAVIVVMTLISRVALGRVIGLSLRAYVAGLVSPALMTTGMVAVMLLLTPALEAALDEQAGVLAGQVALGAVTYALLVATLARGYLREVWQMVLAPRPQPIRQ